MSKIKLTIVILWSLLNTQALKAQDEDKTVTLVVSGQGKTQDEAKQNALRSAIEQAFGAFISSKTEILNDSLVKDEIVSVANGNIQKFEIISEVQIPNGDFATSLKATVSLFKLTTFCESKGVEVEFKGGLFAANIKQKILNEKSEFNALKNICDISWGILNKSIDFKINIGPNPKLINSEKQLYSLPILITASTNTNIELFYNFLKETLINLSISKEDIETYKASNIPIYKLRYLDANNNSHVIFLRNSKSILALQNLIIKSNKYYFDFMLTSNIDSVFVNNEYRIGDLYYFDRGPEETLNKFYVGINGLLENESISGMIEKANQNPLINIAFNFIPSWKSNFGQDKSISDLGFCGVDEISPLYLFTSIVFQEYWSRVDEYFDANIWETDLENFKIGDRFNSISSSCEFQIIENKKASLDIFIAREFTLSEIESFNGYKINKYERFQKL